MRGSGLQTEGYTAGQWIANSHSEFANRGIRLCAQHCYLTCTIQFIKLGLDTKSQPTVNHKSTNKLVFIEIFLKNSKISKSEWSSFWLTLGEVRPKVDVDFLADFWYTFG